jgi:hypothetical protein
MSRRHAPLTSPPSPRQAPILAQEVDALALRPLAILRVNRIRQGLHTARRGRWLWGCRPWLWDGARALDLVSLGVRKKHRSIILTPLSLCQLDLLRPTLPALLSSSSR